MSKYFKLFIAFLFVFLMAFSASAEWVNLTGEEAGTRVNVIESSSISTTLEFEFNGYYQEAVEIDGEDYLFVQSPDASLLMETGKPQLIRFNTSIIIPDMANMTYEILDAEYTTMKTDPIMPSKGHFNRNINPADVPYTFDELYNSSDYYPETNLITNTPYIVRDLRGMSVHFYPMQYNPGREELKICTSLKVKFYPDGGEPVNPFIRSRSFDGVSREFAPIYQNLFVNYGAAGQRYDFIPEPGRLLIIYASQYEDAIQPLADWKIQKGIPTLLADYPNDTGSGKASIKSYIQNLYDSDESLTYIILVGEAGEVPYYNSTYNPSVPSDPQYIKLAGNDHYPEAMIGRLSVTGISNCEYVVDKIVSYEQDPYMDDDAWYHKATGVASNQGNPSDATRMDWIRDMLLDYHYTDVDQIYDPSASATQVTNALNEGRGLLNYLGHGSGTSWGTTGFGVSHIENLDNGDMLPFIVDVACLNGKFSMDTCMEEAWLRAGSIDDPKGAIASHGSSDNDSWVPPAEMQNHMMELLTTDQRNTIGGLCYSGVMSVLDDYGGGGEGHKLVDIKHIFGDPSMVFTSNTPTALTTDHMEIMPVGLSQFEVNITDSDGAPIEEATVCGSTPLGHWAVAYTDENGDATLDFGDPIVDITDMTLTTTAYNCMPSIETVPILGGQAFEGYVSDINVGDFLMADVYIDSIDMTTRAEEDGFYRIYVLEEGTYTLEADFWGYDHYSAEATITESDSMVTHDIQMTPQSDAGTIHGQVLSVTEEPLEGVEVQLVGIDVPPAVTDASGYYEFFPLVPDYDYDLIANDPSYEPVSQAVHVDPNGDHEVNFYMAYIEIFEENDGGFIGEDEWEWGEPTAEEGPAGAYSGMNCWGTDLDDNYNPNANMYLYSPIYTLNLSSTPTLVFYTWYDMKEGWDGGNVKITIDGGENWEVITPTDGYPDNSVVGLTGQPGYTGTSEGWIRQEFDLTAYANETVQFAMRFASTNTAYPGWFVDNFTVTGGIRATASPENFAAAVFEDDVTLTWNAPETELTVTGYNLYRSFGEDDEFGDIYQTFGPDTYSFTDVDLNDGNYTYGLTAVYDDVESETTTQMVEIGGGTGVDDNLTLAPSHYALSQNYPNPFNPTTEITFAIPNKETVTLNIYNLNGQLIKTLVDEEKDAGYYNVTWNGTDNRGSSVASGVYIYRIDSGEYHSTKKMIMLK